MSIVNLKSLVGKLNTTSQRALESAAGMCLSRTHYNIEIEHWLLKLIEDNQSDIPCILAHYQIDRQVLTEDLLRTLDQLKTGNAKPPALSQPVVDLCREAWLITSLEYGMQKTRSGFLLIASLQDEALSRLIHALSKEIKRINLPNLCENFLEIVAGSHESIAATKVSDVPMSSGKTHALEQFTVDLTDLAHQGKIDPVLGRDQEIRQMVDILMRRRQNNPILTGEAGVGKTAVVEGLALRIANAEVPSSLKNVSIKRLDMGLLQAGAGIKGEFENRLKSVIQEIKSASQPVILFIDEAHTLIGAGGAAGQGDAANLLKPELARGELRTIAATTWSEYKQYFEQDAAMVRRFQVVKIEEPSEESAIAMLQGTVDVLEKHHQVRILNEATREAVRLSSRYLPGRQLPDKAISLLDTACAKVAIGQHTVPSALEAAQRQILQLENTKRILNRDAETLAFHDEDITQIEEALDEYRKKADQLNEQCEREKALITQMQQVSKEIEKLSQTADQGLLDDATLQKKTLQLQLRELDKQLKLVQGEYPLLQPWVDGQTVAEIIAGWTGIPVGRMVSNEIQTILSLKERLANRIVGQSQGLEAISESIKTSRAKLTDPRKPIGVFLFLGPSGVGKTETALALAELLYGSQENLTIINMSEFKEEHKVSSLMGAPPGYVGYGHGGVLTEAVRRRPYSLILLDEMEKAHPGVHDIFYQVFDKGMIRDSEGRDIDFKNTVIIMTSNAASDTIEKLCADPETVPAPNALVEALQPELLKIFKPAFLGRVQLVPYYPLSDEIMRQIIALQLSRVQKRIQENYQANLTYLPEVIDYIAERCQQVATGARTIEHLLNRSILPTLSEQFLSAMAENRTIEKIQLSIKDNQFCYV
jgi:type VI secretion system protein VasG